MDKKLVLVIIIIILLAAATAGCSGEEKKKSKKTSYEKVTGNYPQETGWLDSDMGDTPQHVDSTIMLDLNVSEKISEITIMASFQDSDSAHSESDEGSDPDDVTITLTDGTNVSQPAIGTTPCNLEVVLNGTGEDDSHMSGVWELHVQAECGAGKPYTLVPRPGMISLLQYKDQGIAYSLQINYKYLRKTNE